MALTQTTLSAAVSVTDLVIPVTAATGFATSTTAPQFVRIDNEYMIIHPSYAGSTSTKIPVYRRGDQGSSVVAHNALAIVVTGLFSDMIALQAGATIPISIPKAIDDIVTYSVDGAIALPKKNTLVQLDKAGVAAMTLLPPTLDMDGIELGIVGLTAYANTVTTTGSFINGLSSSPDTIWTATTGYAGQGFRVRASQALWVVMYNNAGAFS